MEGAVHKKMVSIFQTIYVQIVVLTSKLYLNMVQQKGSFTLKTCYVQINVLYRGSTQPGSTQVVQQYNALSRASTFPCLFRAGCIVTKKDCHDSRVLSWQLHTVMTVVYRHDSHVLS